MQFYLLVAVAILGPSFGAAVCPGPNVNISPCTCTDDKFFCEGLTSATQLRDIFSQTFPTKALTTITIRRSTLGRLPDNLFGDKSFTEIYFWSNCTLSMPSASTLEASKPFLKVFYVNEYTVIDMLNLDALGEALTSFGIYNSAVYNFKGNPFLPNLNSFEMMRNTLFYVPVLTKARSVTNIIIKDNSITLKSLPANVFANFPKLQMLDLNYNGLVSLSKDWLNVNSDSLSYINLGSNGIVYVEPGAFSGLRSTTRVNLRANKLTTLEEAVFRPILGMTQSSIMISGNPLVCDCSMAWLFRDSELRAKITDGSCEIPGIGSRPFSDVDVSLFIDC